MDPWNQVATDFSFENSQKSHGAKSHEYGGYLSITILFWSKIEYNLAFVHRFNDGQQKTHFSCSRFSVEHKCYNPLIQRIVGIHRLEEEQEKTVSSLHSALLYRYYFWFFFRSSGLFNLEFWHFVNDMYWKHVSSPVTTLDMEFSLYGRYFQFELLLMDRAVYSVERPFCHHERLKPLKNVRMTFP